MRALVRRSLIVLAVAVGAAAAVRCGSITVEDVDASGTGGVSGDAGNNDGPVDCTQLQHDYAAALADAKVCTNSGGVSCQQPVSDQLACGCTTYVVRVDRLAQIRQSWMDGGCDPGVCPAIACIPPSGGSCVVASGATSGHCQDKP
jgi:hypothetical protein